MTRRACSRATPTLRAATRLTARATDHYPARIMVTGRRRFLGATRRTLLAVAVAFGLVASPVTSPVASPLTSALISPVGAAAPAPPAAPAAAPKTPPPKAWIIVDAGTGRVLAGRDIHTAYSPASMSKVMTALTTVERLKPNSTITVTPTAEVRGQSNLTPTGMKAGQRWPLDTMIGLLLVASANDAAYSLASRVGGSLNGFATLETETARRLGLRDSRFSDPAGLDDDTSFGGGPRMSAYDVAVTVRAAIGVPQLARWAATPQFTYRDPTGAPHTAVNHNKLLLPGPAHYNGAIGFKTGFTSLAGNTLAAVARRGNRTIITVVMNTWDPNGWSRELLDRGFRSPATPAAQTGERLPDTRVTPFSQRAADRAAFLALAQGPPIPDGTGVAPNATVTTYAGTTTLATTTPPTSTTSAPTSTPSTTGTARAIAAQDPPTTSRGSAGGGGTGGARRTLLELVLVLLVIATTAVVLRRRAVIKRRQRRLARRRQTQAALRRGSLPVVDGRYRAGMRTGNPVPSHVKIHRDRGQSGPDS